MKEYDHVELLVEKERYAQYGVHKGMSGIIAIPGGCMERGWSALTRKRILTNFPILTVREEDLKVIRQAEGAL